MSFTYDKQDNSIVVGGIEQGMAVSPHKGIGSIKCANISTETGEVMCNYARSMDSQDFTVHGTLTAVIGSTTQVQYSIQAGTTNKLLGGTWIVVTGSTNTATWLANGTYYVTFSTVPTQFVGLSSTYNGPSAISSAANSDTATYTILTNTTSTGGTMTQPVQAATESYNDAQQIPQERYYILDTEGHVWVKDTGVATSGVEWALIDTTTARISASLSSTAMASGIAVYNGWLFIFIQNCILLKLTSELGLNINQSTSAPGWTRTGGLGSNTLNTPAGSNNPHFAYVSKSGALYYTDGPFVGSVFATAGVPNLWSYAKYTFSGTTLTISQLINGVQPYNGMPISFFSSAGTSGLPTGVSASTTYYVKNGTVSTSSGIITFQIAATPAGSAINLTGGSGTQYYNTFDPTLSTTFIFSPQALTIPQQQDTTQCLTEIGDSILVGCKSNTLYFWDGIATTPNGFLFLPEENTVNMITVNNMAYAFSGSRGNIYITNGNTSSLVTSVPDYVTGLIDPYFSWGGAMYARGRIWFSLSDQSSSHTGTCGGIWSFVPTQNLFIGQDTGLALRLEHESSYGTYNGVANVLINIQNQQALGLQYFSAWTSDSVSGAVYGIDKSSTTPYTGGQTIIETDYIPMGTFLDKGSFTSLQTKYAVPLVSGESIQIKWRKGLTDSWTNIGTDNTVGSLGTRLPLSLAQLIYGQFQIILMSTATNPTFTRLMEIRLKK